LLQGKARQKFAYFSPINRLRAQFENRVIGKRLQYPQVGRVDPGKYQDIWQGQHIQSLKARSIKWAGKTVPNAGKYFGDDTQLALGLATDGIPLWKRSRLDCWPLILTNYSLPPEIRSKREYQICCGLIPGTCQGRDIACMPSD
jgi:hypothetical protein